MNRLLLDTQAVIWWDANDPRLGGRSRSLISESDEVFVSAASAWEITIKAALGKLRSTRAVSTVLGENRFTELPVTVAHAEAVAKLPKRHADPFDRLIIATAQSEGLAVMTTDEKFEEYDVVVLDARK